jgi:general secretion pathway protein J
MEILLAMSIMAVIVVVLVGSARVGIRAWEAGERQAAAQQEIRALVELLTDTLSVAYPYKGRLGGGLERVVLFKGEADEVRFVTTAPPLALDTETAPYHAVTLRRSAEDELELVERLVPAEEPFGDDPRTVLSRTVTGFQLQYLDEKGEWQDAWDGPKAGGIPRAVRVELTIRGRLGPQPVPVFVVPIPLGKAAT